MLLAFCLAGCGGSKSTIETPDRKSQIDPGGETFGHEEKWRETEVPLPPYPEEANLREFFIRGEDTGYVFFIDSRSLRVDKDGVVRYVVLVRSPAGVENVSYEGIHCDPREWKVYAYATSDRAWSSARDTQWRKIVWRRVNDYRFSLYQYYFCPDGYPVRTVNDALTALSIRETIDRK